MYRSKAKQGINYLFPMGRQVFSDLWESRAPSCIMMTGEDKHHHSACHPIPCFSSPSCAENDMIEFGIALWSAAVTSPSCVSSKFFRYPQFLTGWAVLQAEKTLSLSQHWSAVAKISQCYQHHFQDKYKPYPNTRYCEKN